MFIPPRQRALTVRSLAALLGLALSGLAGCTSTPAPTAPAAAPAPSASAPAPSGGAAGSQPTSDLGRDIKAQGEDMRREMQQNRGR